MKEIPNSLLWIFESKDLAGKKYLRDLDFIRSNTAVNFVVISPRNGVHLQNLQQCHGVIGEMTAYAHRIGLKIGLHLVTREGFYNAIFSSGNHPAIDQAQIFPIADPKKAQAITHDIELTLNQNGYARFTHQAIWGRSKIAPIYAEIVKAVLFEKTGDGFYRADSICDVTDQVRIIDARTNLTELEVNLGAEQKGKTVFVVLAQYYNCTAVSDDWESFKQLMDAYSDIPLDGVQMDEYGYVLLNTHKISHGEEPPFRGRMYAKGMKRYYEETYAQDFDQLLFDMR